MGLFTLSPQQKLRGDPLRAANKVAQSASLSELPPDDAPLYAPSDSSATSASGTRVNSSLATTETSIRSLIHELGGGRDVMNFCKQTNVADQRMSQAVLD
ncbi:hypothetical protein MUK42_11631 [Musa troglodytarum]|uniref:Uncharacterized protein n=1 Tax=Musa troglodytarum TaxID=320322 RepID=A0A9E7KGE2_9LILI|nr:hypothetical protein MUK42_11631 [Musa troglodytarum]